MEAIPYLLSYRTCSYDLDKVNGFRYNEKKAFVVLMASMHITDSLLHDHTQFCAFCCLVGSSEVLSG